ncbi:leucyl-cystinyl aminopeptidase [Eurytemora carolleeae]|uniref:leucyl-cystinyl aminopeptidase n=1 Tax=Eurytemora carolleeae TaxID=1294199 RepID=UPI000C7617E5|nr:leucyl-cystinyl aminopeptidase [Eurytemora carolleeae]|eukprot:XP_023337488.1 leucyl-cystinyl aminopeptidase-like [Eurytemora affinis]
MFLNEDRDDVAFLTGSGSSESRIHSKRDLYERGHVAVCSHKQAICITVFVFTSIVATSFIVAFARPWNDCGSILETISVPEAPFVPLTETGEVFPWNDVRLPIFIRPISYDLELTPNLTTLAVKGIIKLIFQVNHICKGTNYLNLENYWVRFDD